jgi:hypothetical protein
MKENEGKLLTSVTLTKETSRGGGGISPTGDKTKTRATSSKDFFGKLSKNSPYFLEKKKKRNVSPDLDS